MNDRSRLHRNKILYHYPKDLIVGSDDESVRVTKHLVDFANKLIEDLHVSTIYILVIVNNRVSSIYVEFDERRSVLSVKRTMLTCGMDLNLVEFHKIDGLVKEHLRSFLVTSYYIDENLYMFHRNEEDVDKCADRLT
jgi:hypothetical protein